MRSVLLAILLGCASLSAQINPGMTTAQIQSALNAAASGSTVTFAAGSYSITQALNMPCRNLALTGPAGTNPTAVLNATFSNASIFDYPANCQALGSFKYLRLMNTGGLYFAVGSNGNFDFEHNGIGNLPSAIDNANPPNNTKPAIGLFFDGNLSTKLSNVTIKYNTFGDASSCTAVFGSTGDAGGYCAGVITSQGEDNNVDVEYNTFIHVEEPIHLNQLAQYAPGQPNSVCISCVVSNNYLLNYHRIGIEIQVSTPVNSLMLEHNAVIDPLNSSYGTFAVSLACCQSGYTIGQNGFSPALTFNDNVLISSQPAGAKPPPYGVEFWGTGSLGTNSLVEGNFSNGYTWGWGTAPWAINNNTICGPNYATQGGYISNQQGANNPPSQVGNVTGPSCQTTTSTAPAISPNGGNFQTSQTVTLSDTGRNTGIWYTIDGSSPVPGSGAAKLYTAPFTLSATATVKAVGMWGNANQPTSYPAGYGYVPSAVVSATFTSGGVPPVNPPIIINLPPQTIPPQTIPARTLTCTPNAQGSYDCTSN